MAKETKEQIDLIKTEGAGQQVDKAKLRRAYGLVDSAIDNLEQARDILKANQEKAPMVIEGLKALDNMAEDVPTKLGY